MQQKDMRMQQKCRVILLVEQHHNKECATANMLLLNQLLAESFMQSQKSGKHLKLCTIHEGDGVNPCVDAIFDSMIQQTNKFPRETLTVQKLLEYALKNMIVEEAYGKYQTNLCGSVQLFDKEPKYTKGANILSQLIANISPFFNYDFDGYIQLMGGLVQDPEKHFQYAFTAILNKLRETRSISSEEEAKLALVVKPDDWMGIRVMARGLKKRPDLNGQCGTVVSFQEDTGRYGIQFTLGEGENRIEKRIALKPENFLLAPGASVEIKDLQKRPEFNGERKRVENWVEKTGRYALTGDLYVKPVNVNALQATEDDKRVLAIIDIFQSLTVESMFEKKKRGELCSLVLNILELLLPVVITDIDEDQLSQVPVLLNALNHNNHAQVLETIGCYEPYNPPPQNRNLESQLRRIRDKSLIERMLNRLDAEEPPNCIVIFMGGAHYDSMKELIANSDFLELDDIAAVKSRESAQKTQRRGGAKKSKKNKNKSNTKRKNRIIRKNSKNKIFRKKSMKIK